MMVAVVEKRGVENSRTADPEEQRERGLTWAVSGWLLWGFALLFLFFNPAALRRGTAVMAETAAVLGAVGLVLNIIGWRIRRKAK